MVKYPQMHTHGFRLKDDKTTNLLYLPFIKNAAAINPIMHKVNVKQVSKLDQIDKQIKTSSNYIFPALFGVILMLFGACSQDKNPPSNSIAGKDTVPYPHTTVLAELPDSNQPRQIMLKKSPPPIPIKIPTQVYRSGSNNVVQLAPPVKYDLMDKVTGLPVSPEAQGKGLFTTYTSDDGVSLDEIYCGFRDNLGNLWFGTNGGGISRYDGRKFTNYTTANGLAYNLIWCINQDRKGNLWIGTDGGGVSKFDGKSFTNYTTKDGLAQNVVYCIREDSAGNLWFGTNGGGVSRYDGKTFTNYTTANGLAGNNISDIVTDRKGNLWFGTRGGGVSRYDGTVFSNYTITDGLANNAVNSLLADRSGNLWIGTNGGGLSKYDGKRFTNYTITSGLEDNTVLTSVEDKAGNLWFGTNKGASKFDGKNFTNYTTEQGLANNKVTSITVDEKGNMWFGTFGGGISKFAGSSMTNFTTVQGLANNVVYSIIEDSSGSLWLGTNGGGTIKYDGGSFTNYATLQGLAHNEIYGIAKDSRGNLWFGTYRHGVSKYNGKSFTNYTTAQGLSNNTVFRIVEDHHGNLWFATSGGGVSKFDGMSFTSYTTTQGLANNVVFSITEDKKGNLWFGTLGGGVSKFDGKSFTNFTTQQGLADNSIWAITEDKSGNLWFGTQSGLSLLRSKKIQQLSEYIGKKLPLTSPLFETITTKDGLPHDFISQIIPSGEQNLYIGTNFGMCELIPVTDSNGIDQHWVVGKIYNTTTGYPVKDVNSGPGAMLIDSKGIIWMGTGSDKTGLVRFNPQASVFKNPVPPNVVLNSIKINNEIISWHDLLLPGEKDSISSPQSISEEISSFGRLLTNNEKDSMRTAYGKLSFEGVRAWYPVPEGLVLPHENNNISFDFNAIETGRNFLVKYQYKLEGYDKQWSHPGTENTASYGNIFEGKYSFQVRAQSPEGIWSVPVTYTFKVLPPWWRTWWAYVSYALLFLWGLRIFSLYRERRLRFEKDKLELQVKHRTEMLENTIQTLKNTQSQLIQSEKMASLGELTSGIAHEIQNPLNFVNNFSEVNKELLADLHLEIEKGNMTEIRDIANYLLQNTEKITHHGKRADSIVKSMLQHSGSSSGNKEPANINKLADEYLKLAYHVILGKEKGFEATLETHYDSTIEKINIIPQEIGRVLLNLYNNAFYAVAEKKKMAGAGFHPTVSISTKKLGNHIELRVRDNGMGIPERVKEKIFQPFFTTKPTGQGTGLGLSLSYDIVKTHNGTLQVNSKEAEFTEFIIILPA